MREETMQCLKPLIKHLKHFKNQAQELDSADRVALIAARSIKNTNDILPVFEFLMDFKAMKVKKKKTDLTVLLPLPGSEMSCTVTCIMYLTVTCNRLYSYSRYWTGSNFQLRLMWGVFSNANDIHLFLVIFPA